MWGYRSRNCADVVPVRPAEARPDFDQVATPLVPAGNLRAHWEIGPDGKLEMRWDVATPAPVTPLKQRPFRSSQGSERRTA